MIASLVKQCLVFTLLLQSCIMGLCSDTHILRVSLRQNTLTNFVADAANELIPRRKSTSCWTIPRGSTVVRVRVACLHPAVAATVAVTHTVADVDPIPDLQMLGHSTMAP
jgi:hypothetical protein